MATITDAGLAATAKLLNGVDSVAPFTHMATGSGSTAESAGQTALVTENTAYGSARAAATCSYVADNKARWIREFDFTGTVTIREIGIFNASSAGTMLLRHVLTGDKVFESGESVEITIDVVTA
jgi:hypothetical protein